MIGANTQFTHPSQKALHTVFAFLYRVEIKKNAAPRIRYAMV